MRKIAAILGVLAVIAAALLVLAPQGSTQQAQGLGIGAYYLMNLDPAKIQWHYWSVLVIEPDEATQEILSTGLDNSDLLLAYLNIGYAEEWRSYWPDIANASWVHEPTEYAGEYYIEYWNPQWHQIMKDMASQYLSMGFEGVYLDNIDASEILALSSPPWSAGIDTFEAMVDLVCNISQHVKSINPQARIFINIGGAYNLLYNNVLLSCIDGVLREELWTMWTGYNQTSPQDPQETQSALEALQTALSSGKTIMVADPARTPSEAEQLCARAWSNGFIPVPQPAWAPDYEMPPLASWCTGAGGPVVSLAANATLIQPGEAVEIEWSILGADGWVTNIPGAGLPSVDILVLSPLEAELVRVDRGVGAVVGYLSAATIGGWEPWADNVTQDMIIGYTSWGDAVVNVSDPRWVDIVLGEAIPYILSKGFHGVMLDNLDQADAYPEIRDGLVSLVNQIREAYPGIAIVVNRGFTVIPDIAGSIDAVIFEGYGSYYDYAAGEYRPYTGQDLEWINATLQSLMQLAAQHGFKVLGLAYGDPAQPGWSQILDTVCSLNEPYGNPVYIAGAYLQALGQLNPCGGENGTFIVYYGRLADIMQQSGAAVVTLDTNATFYIYAWSQAGSVNKTINITVKPVEGSIEAQWKSYWGWGAIYEFNVTLDREASWLLKVRVENGKVVDTWGAVVVGEEGGYQVLAAEPWNRGPQALGGFMVKGEDPDVEEIILVVGGREVARWVEDPGPIDVELKILREGSRAYVARLIVENTGLGPVKSWYVDINTTSKITMVLGGSYKVLDNGLIQITPDKRHSVIKPGHSVQVEIRVLKQGDKPYLEIVGYGAE